MFLFSDAYFSVIIPNKQVNLPQQIEDELPLHVSIFCQIAATDWSVSLRVYRCVEAEISMRHHQIQDQIRSVTKSEWLCRYKGSSSNQVHFMEK